MTSRKTHSAASRMIGFSLAAAVLIGGAFFTLRQSIPELQRKRQAMHDLERQNAEIQREIQLKKEYMHDFDTNPEVPKMLIRQKLDRYQDNTREYRYKAPE